MEYRIGIHLNHHMYIALRDKICTVMIINEEMLETQPKIAPRANYECAFRTRGRATIGRNFEAEVYRSVEFRRPINLVPTFVPSVQ